MKVKNMTTLHFNKTIGRSLSWRCRFVLVPLALVCFALVQNTQAQLPAPSPDGGYPGGNTAEGINALHDVNTAVGINNTAVGANALTHDTSGQYNVAVGSGALESNTTGDFNMAIGTEALQQNNASFNLAIGFRVGFMNTTGRHLTGIGAAALRNNTEGDFNTAIGADALRENTTSGANVAVGDSALASYNGLNAGIDGFNTALVSIALTALADGFQNTVVGRRALQFFTSGNNNVAVGWRTGDGVSTGDGNTFIGTRAGATPPAFGTYNNTILLGITGDPDGNNPNGRAYIGNVRGVATGNGDGIAVLIDSTGQLGTSNSSRRFKEDIKPMDQTSETILALKPVTFHYKGGDTKKAQQIPQFGLIAEDVEQVNRDLVVYDNDGQVLSVRYDAVNVMLLNEFQKEHKKVEEQQTSIADLKSTVALQRKEMQVLTAQLKEQAAQIQKVSAQLEASKPAPKVVTKKERFDILVALASASATSYAVACVGPYPARGCRVACPHAQPFAAAKGIESDLSITNRTVADRRQSQRK
jgi:trimeric autotransporter adhesin